MPRSSASTPVFRIDPWTHRLGGVFERTARLWVWLGQLESAHLADEIEHRPIDRPIYVTGLARAGTTLVLEMLASHRSTASHRYRDYPSVFTPVLWNRHLDRSGPHDVPPVERAHRDGIMVTPDSPEAMEEIVWMRFFPRAHDPTVSHVLDGRTEHPRFEAFYRDHLRKILLVRDGTRYLAKANYHITRLEYLLRLFPDARFVVPVRRPTDQVSSLMAAHALFSMGVAEEPRARDHLRRLGHFEFGPDFRPINTGDGRRAAAMTISLQGDQAAGAWARYWSDLYGHVADRLEQNARLRAATLVVRLEELCLEPRATIAAIMAHCDLSARAPLLDELAARVRAPARRQPPWSSDDLQAIERETHETAARLGYG